MIQVENLSFSYQNNKVFKISLFLLKRGVSLYYWENGSKVNLHLLKLLAGLIFQQEGNIKISGYDAKKKRFIGNKKIDRNNISKIQKIKL